MNEVLTSASLRRLRVFLALCDTLHMARTAEQLGIAQPALSQQVHGLEQAIGVRLFHRRKRGLEMTLAGEALRSDVRALLSLHTGAIDHTRRVARGEIGQLKVGYVGSSMLEGLFPGQLKAMRDQFPGVELTLRENSVEQMLAALAAGDLDVALVRAPIQAPPPLRSRFHSRQDLVVVLPLGHPLAALPHIPIARLADEPMVAFPDPEEVGIMRVATRMAAAAGCSLRIGWRVSEIGSVLGLVAAGMGYGIVPRSIGLMARRQLVARPLADAGATSELWLVWHGQRSTPPLAHFLDITATGEP